MISWLKDLLAPPVAVGPPHLLATFRDQSDPLSPTAELVAPGEWRIPDRPAGFAPLFRIEPPEIAPCLLTFRAELRADCPLRGAALELLCRHPGRRRLVARSPSRHLTLPREWNFLEVTQHLGADQSPSLLRLGLAVETAATIEIRNVQVLATPVA